VRTTHPEAGPSRRALLLAGVGVVGLAACAAEEPAPEPTPSPTAAETEAEAEVEATEEPTEEETEPSGTTVATSAVAALSVYAEPDDPDVSGGEGEEQFVLERAEEISGEVVLLVLETGSAWLHVQLPVRPNGSTGWVRARDVRTSRHDYAIDITLGGHELVLTQGDREVLRTPVGVGRTDRPTPGGDYYTKELLRPPDPNGIYGPYAYGLSGFSNVLTEFLGGDAVIGIHGTNEPDLVGTDVSSGCIRLPNETITRLVEEIALPIGVPVTIRD
jgi:lipoprotein-anchoring transpeptidase ErfK/SrfK